MPHPQAHRLTEDVLEVPISLRNRRVQWERRWAGNAAAPQPWQSGGLPSGWRHVVGLSPAARRHLHLVRTPLGWGVLQRWRSAGASRTRLDVSFHASTLGGLAVGVGNLDVVRGATYDNALFEVLRLVARAYLPLVENPEAEEFLMALDALMVPEVAFWEDLPVMPPGDLPQRDRYMVLPESLLDDLAAFE